MLKVKRLKAGSYEVPGTSYFFYHRYAMEPIDANGESTRGLWYVYEQDGVNDDGFIDDRFVDIAGSYKSAKAIVLGELNNKGE